MRRFLILTFLLACAGTIHAQSKNLDIYWIDVEGGAATLIVSPTGELLLIDTGFPDDDRDAKRIYAATQLAGLKWIDYLVISHYDTDHVGGVAALVKMIPVERFYDHGDGIEPENLHWLKDYQAISAGKRKIVKAGDEIPIKGFHALVIASDEHVIAKPVNGGGGRNPLCENAQQMAKAARENQRMVGLLLSYNKFTYLNLVDLD